MAVLRAGLGPQPWPQALPTRAGTGPATTLSAGRRGGPMRCSGRLVAPDDGGYGAVPRQLGAPLEDGPDPIAQVLGNRGRSRLRLQPRPALAHRVLREPLLDHAPRVAFQRIV